MGPKASLIVGTGMELGGIGQILHGVTNHNSLETTIGAIFIASGSLCLSSGIKYLRSEPTDCV